MMTNDGSVDLLTVQMVISLNELMLNLTIKHRDAVFTRSTLGSTADAVLAAKKADSMHVSSILATSFCELAAVATLTGFMATFNLPSSPDVYDDATGAANPTRPPRTTDPSKLTDQAFRLIAIELAFSFLSAFAQYRFHDIDLRRPFDGDGERGDRDEKKTKETNAKRSRLGDEKKPFFCRVKNVFASLDPHRLRAYFVMTVFFAMCVVGTLLGTLWTYAVCPRVRRDGHLFLLLRATESGRYGPPAESEAYWRGSSTGRRERTKPRWCERDRRAWSSRREVGLFKMFFAFTPSSAAAPFGVLFLTYGPAALFSPRRRPSLLKNRSCFSSIHPARLGLSRMNVLGGVVPCSEEWVVPAFSARLPARASSKTSKNQIFIDVGDHGRRAVGRTTFDKRNRRPPCYVCPRRAARRPGFRTPLSGGVPSRAAEKNSVSVRLNISEQCGPQGGV